MPRPDEAPARRPAVADPEHVQQLLDAVPAPLEPLDVSALDGFLCGVILQPAAPAPAAWLPLVFDVDGRALPPRFDAAGLTAAAQARHAELRRAIDARDWFDPWVFGDETTPVADAVGPWVAGFATAMSHFPALMDLDAPALLEPLALLYLHLDPAQLEDADALLAEIETLEPPPDLAEAVQDLVRAVMLIADVTRPQAAAPRRASRPAPGRPRRPVRR